MPNFDVILVGHFARDRDVYQGKARAMLGGAVFYGGHVLASLQVRSAILTRLAEKERSLLDPLAEKGVQVFCRYGASTTGIENTYLDETRDRRLCRPIEIGDPFQPGDFPRLPATIVHIAPLICGEAPQEFVKELANWGQLSLDAQGFLRVHRQGSLKLEKNKDFEAILCEASFLKLDHAEAEILTSTPDLESALTRIHNMGVKEIVLTHGEGVIACQEGRRVDAKWTAGNLAGRTGRGDTCMSAYLACRALGLEPEESLPVAAVVTSLKMEREGPFSGKLEQLDPGITAPLYRKLNERGIQPVEH